MSTARKFSLSMAAALVAILLSAPTFALSFGASNPANGLSGGMTANATLGAVRRLLREVLNGKSWAGLESPATQRELREGQALRFERFEPSPQDCS